ncbi:MAG: ribonuclease HII [Actinobacteria bacterium]|nr:ribonuclease HII [Actinomycetota bacterium]
MFDLEEEQNIFSHGYNVIGAIDEAGRGPLAGPVVAACVLMKSDSVPRISDDLLLINDSKKLTAKRREGLFNIITGEFDVGIGMCDHNTIDRINILQASFLAMKKAIGALKQKPDFVILDGKFPIPNLSVKQKAIINGDGLVFSIAAASILAKVTRDRIMMEMHEIYPDYGFDRHKGYGTKLHIERLRQFGPSSIHRKSFRPVKILLPQRE